MNSLRIKVLTDYAFMLFVDMLVFSFSIFVFLVIFRVYESAMIGIPIGTVCSIIVNENIMGRSPKKKILSIVLVFSFMVTAALIKILIDEAGMGNVSIPIIAAVSLFSTYFLYIKIYRMIDKKI